MAAAVLLGAWAPDASALALGRITVRSALGEPLNAEIDIPEITPDEISSLRAKVASPDAFKSAGLEYSPALSNLKITFDMRSDGSYFLRLTSPRAINDPFVDLLLDSSWSSGHILRDYTMLFDPPASRQNQQPLIAAAPAPAPAPAPQSSEPTALPPVTAAPAPSSSSPTPAPAPAPVTGGEGKQVTVQSGETAGKIAAANKPAAVSLDQMLVAMLRANPDAFTGGNVNRLRAGAVLDIPGVEEAALIPPDEAKQTLVAQSRDFNEFRRRLAETVPTTRVAAAERQSSGKVTAQVEEKRPTAAAPDKLTLSKGAAQGKSAPEDKIARDRAAKDTATRVAELNKNISDLSKLGTATTPAGSASAAKPGIPVPLGTPASAPKPAVAPAPVTAAASAPKAPAPVTAAASAPKTVAPAVAEAAKPASAPLPAAAVASAPTLTAASAPAAAVLTTTAASAVAPAARATVAASSSAAPKPVVAPKPGAPAKAVAKTPAPEPSFLDDLLESPLILEAAGLVVALGAGFGLYRIQQRKKTAQVDSSFLESRLQPDSFFGASGGQRVDTNETSGTGSSMVYSPSQLDAAGDVDPVAEADVYLAYGRDLQAEEILKEALRTQPQRVAIHTKLLEIYAKRRDAKAFELVASEAYGLTHGEGSEWSRVCELGQELDPSNSLYRPGGRPHGSVAATAGTGKPGSTIQTHAVPVQTPGASDIDLDLDFSIGGEELAAAPAPAKPVAPVAAAPGGYERTQSLAKEPPAPVPSLDLDFGSPAAAARAPQRPAAEPATLDAPDLVLDENSLSFDAAPPAPMAAATSPAVAAAARAGNAGMMEFDLGALSLDLDKPPAESVSRANTGLDTESPSTAGSPLSTGGFDDTGSDPLATKLALAQEFNAIGDPDGARSLAQEVIAEASGELKTKAQRFLAEIG